jgi:hypothetical protein
LSFGAFIVMLALITFQPLMNGFYKILTLVNLYDFHLRTLRANYAAVIAS